MPLTTVTLGDFVEFDHPLTRQTTYGTVVGFTFGGLMAFVRTGSGEECAVLTADLYDPERPAYAATA